MNPNVTMHDLAELYAVGALHAQELSSFDDHLEVCAQCGSRLPSLLEAVAALIPDSPAPSHIWDRIVSAIR